MVVVGDGPSAPGLRGALPGAVFLGRRTGDDLARIYVPAVMVPHESADGVLGVWGLPSGAARRAADALNRRTAYAYTRVVCTTA